MRMRIEIHGKGDEQIVIVAPSHDPTSGTPRGPVEPFDRAELEQAADLVVKLTGRSLDDLNVRPCDGLLAGGYLFQVPQSASRLLGG